MAKKKPLSTEEHIALLEAQLRKPDLPAKTAAAISRRISLLKGTERTYQGQGGLQNQARKKQQAEESAKLAAERQRQEAAGELSESQCQVRLFYAICDTVQEENFDGLPITANPNPTGQMIAINRKWSSLSDDVRSKIQALAIERQQTEQRSPLRYQGRPALSGNEEIRFLDRAERLMSNQPQPESLGWKHTPPRVFGQEIRF